MILADNTTKLCMWWMSYEFLEVQLVLLAHLLVKDGPPLPRVARWTDSGEGWEGEMKK